MKKTLLSIVAGLAVINTASAGIKETCLENPDKLVWVEKTERCVPINTCKASDPTIVESYCNKVFKDIQVVDPGAAVGIAEEYIKEVMRLRGDYINSKTSFLFGQDYFGFSLSDGGYVVFEFDDVMDLTKHDTRKGAMTAMCTHVYGGVLIENKSSFECDGITENVCKKIADFMIHNSQTWNDALVDAEYTEDGVCKVSFMN